MVYAVFFIVFHSSIDPLCRGIRTTGRTPRRSFLHGLLLQVGQSLLEFLLAHVTQLRLILLGDEGQKLLLLLPAVDRLLRQLTLMLFVGDDVLD